MSITQQLIRHIWVYGYGMLATLLLLTIIHISIEYESELHRILDVVLISATAIVSAGAVAKTRPRLYIATFLAVVTVASEILEYSLTSPESVDAGTLPGQLLFWFVAFCLVSDLLRRRGTLTTQLLGAICLYIVMAIAFSRVYQFIESFTSYPAFTTPALTGENESLSPADAIYYSFVTQTTLGYGDIAPVSKTARAFAVIQATLGVLYIAVVVAAIVSTFQAHERHTRRSTPADES